MKPAQSSAESCSAGCCGITIVKPHSVFPVILPSRGSAGGVSSLMPARIRRRKSVTSAENLPSQRDQNPNVKELRRRFSFLTPRANMPWDGNPFVTRVKFAGERCIDK